MTGGWLDPYLSDPEPEDDLPEAETLGQRGGQCAPANVVSCPECGAVSVRPIRTSAHRPTRTWECQDCHHTWNIDKRHGNTRVYLW